MIHKVGSKPSSGVLGDKRALLKHVCRKQVYLANVHASLQGAEVD
jgi:hypothetical protein